MCHDLPACAGMDLQSPEAEVDVVKPNRIIVEVELKKLIRGLRMALKKLFNDWTEQKHYHWVDSKVQEKTFEFYLQLVDDPSVSVLIA